MKLYKIVKFKFEFLGMLAATSPPSLLRSVLTGKGIVRGGDGVIQTDEEIIRAGEGQAF